MTPTKIKKELAELGIRANRLRGQLFLIDRHALRAILEAAELTPRDAVLEIGPGLGVLTRELVARAGSVVAVELDQAIAKYLQTKIRSRKFHLVACDVRERSNRELIKPCATEDYKLVANIPYNITSDVLEKFLEEEPAPQLIVLLLQREVAERISAAPPHLSRLAVLVQYFGHPEIIRRVSREAFWPSPRVESAIVRIRRYPKEVLARRETLVPRAAFFRFVRAGFSSPRRKLAGNLYRNLGISRARILEVLAAAGIPGDSRAERLSLEHWFSIAKLLQSS